jgi:hypothetical protein
MVNDEDRGAPGSGAEDVELPIALVDLEAAMLDAYAKQAEWPARVAAAVFAGVDYAVERPDAIEPMAITALINPHSKALYTYVIVRWTDFLRRGAPPASGRPGSTGEAMVAGVVGLVGDHIRIGRLDRLVELRPELVLLTLLPYLGFSEAQHWANRFALDDPEH